MFELLYYIPVYAALREIAGLYDHYLQTSMGDNLERRFKDKKKEEICFMHSKQKVKSCFLPFCASVCCRVASDSSPVSNI